ncbi:hypothetical protein BJV74DRAFT_292322 [Russula compacta]|nr:hypothetical protein BJV74DRAFT_292322 [Russula compacta]
MPELVHFDRHRAKCGAPLTMGDCHPQRPLTKSPFKFLLADERPRLQIPRECVALLISAVSLDIRGFTRGPPTPTLRKVQSKASLARLCHIAVHECFKRGVWASIKVCISISASEKGRDATRASQEYEARDLHKFDAAFFFQSCPRTSPQRVTRNVVLIFDGPYSNIPLSFEDGQGLARVSGLAKGVCIRNCSQT